MYIKVETFDQNHKSNSGRGDWLGCLQVFYIILYYTCYTVVVAIAVRLFRFRFNFFIHFLKKDVRNAKIMEKR